MRRCSVRLCSLLSQLRLSVPNTWSPVAVVASTLPDELHEGISESHGGLKNFFLLHPDEFEVGQNKNVTTVRRRFKLPEAPTHVPTVTVPILEPNPNQVRRLSEVEWKPSRSHSEVCELTKLIKNTGKWLSELPSFFVPLEALSLASEDLELMRLSPLSEIVVVGTKQFSRLGPQYRRDVRSVIPSSEEADSKHADLRVEAFEAFRLARFLSTSDFVGIQGLSSVAASCVSRDIHHVLASYPELFEIDPESGVRFILHREFWVSPKKVDEELIGKSVGELEDLLRQLVKQKKQMSYGKLMKRRATIIHHLQRKKYPKGNVLQDERVLCYYMFDLLPTEGGIALTELKEQLPDNGRYCANPAPALLERYPNLFFLYEEKAGQWIVQRADLPRPTVRSAADIDDAELVHCVLSALPKDLDPQRAINISTIIMMLEKPVKDKIGQLGGWQQFLKQHPDSFVLVGDGTSFKVVDPRVVGSA